MLNIQTLFYRIGASNQEFKQKMSESKGKLQEVEEKTKDNIRTLRNWSAVAGATATAVLYALNRTVQGTNQTASDIAKLSEQTGIAAEKMQALGYAAKQNNSSMETLGSSLVRMTRRLEAANQGNETYAGSYRRMGVQIHDTNGRLRATEDIFLDLADAFAASNDENLKTQVAFDVLGQSGYDLIPLLNQGRQEIIRLAEEANRLGIVLSRENIDKFAKYDQVLVKWREGMNGVKMQVTTSVVPVFSLLTEKAGDALEKFMDWARKNPEIVSKSVILSGALIALGLAFGGVALGITIVSTGISILKTTFGILTNPIFLLILLSGLLYTAWEEDWGGLQTLVTDAVDAIKLKWDELVTWWEDSDVGKAVGEWWDKVKEIWDGKSELTFGEKIQETISVTVQAGWEWLKEKLPPSWIEKGEQLINIVLGTGGELYDAVKKGLDTGDWSDFWNIASDTWSKGVLLGVTLWGGALGTAKILGLIRTGLGIAAATVGTLGVPGLLGALTVLIKLKEAQENGEGYYDFGWKMFLAIAAGLGIGMFTGNPYVGALAFTIVLNLDWKWLKDPIDKAMKPVREALGTAPSKDGQLMMEVATMDEEERKELIESLPKHGELVNPIWNKGEGARVSLQELQIGEYEVKSGDTLPTLYRQHYSEQFETYGQFEDLWKRLNPEMNPNMLFPEDMIRVPIVEYVERVIEEVNDAVEDAVTMATKYKNPTKTSMQNTQAMQEFLANGGMKAVTRASEELNVPMEWVLAQWGLETSYFQGSNMDIYNLGGVKAAPGENFVERWTWEEIGGVKQEVLAKFKVYEDLDEYVDDWVNAIKNKWSKAVGAETLADYAAGLTDQGLYGPGEGWIGKYATDSDYLGSIDDVLYNVERYLDLTELQDMTKQWGYDSVAYFIQGVIDGTVKLEGEAAKRFVFLMGDWRFDDPENDAMAHRWGYDVVYYFMDGVRDAVAEMGPESEAEFMKLMERWIHDKPENDEEAMTWGLDVVKWLIEGIKAGVHGSVDLAKQLFAFLGDSMMDSLRERFPEKMAEIEALIGEAFGTVELAFGEGGMFDPATAKLNQLNETTKQWTENLSQGLSNAIGYGRGLKDTFEGVGSVLDNFLGMIASQFLQTQVFAPLFEKIGFGDFLAGLPIFHDGGMILHPAAYYHTGGFIGELKSDEVPIIAQTGERVLSRTQNDQFENMLAGISGEDSGAMNVDLTINAVDPASFQELLMRDPDLIKHLFIDDFGKNGPLRKIILQLARG